MSNITMLAPPVWYDDKENLVKILTGMQETQGATEIDNVVIGASLSRESETGSTNMVNSKSTIIGSAINHKYPGITIENTCIINSVYAATENDNETVSNCCLINSSVDFGNDTSDITNVIAIGVQSGGIGNTKQNVVQIGSRNVQYTAQIGDGTGTLKCVATNATEAESAKKAITTDFTNGTWSSPVKSFSMEIPQSDTYQYRVYQIVAYDDTNNYPCIVYFGDKRKTSIAVSPNVTATVTVVDDFISGIVYETKVQKGSEDLSFKYRRIS